MVCRAIVEASKDVGADAALPFCGLGVTLYDCEEYEFACRAFLKAREIREATLGLECVDTATVLNNLGCCFMNLGRSQEALAYFKIAQAILECELGNCHTRSLTATGNIAKCEKEYFENVPSYKFLWATYESDQFSKKKPKKKLK